MGYNVDADGNRIFSVRNIGLRKRVFEDTVTGDESMRVDGSAANLDEAVWDGESSFWTDPSIGSKTAGSKRTGTYGWDSGVTSQNNEVKFTRSTPYQPSSDSIEGWINLQALPATGVIQARWELSNSAKGSGLDLLDYLSSQDIGLWQHFSIPLADFNLPAENVDEFRLRSLNIAGIDYWLDDLRLVSGNGSKTFRMAAVGIGEWLIGSITLVVAAADTGWDSDSFCDIAGGLANGLQLRHRDLAGATNFWKLVCKENSELFGHYEPVVDTAFNNNQRQLSFVLRPEPASVIVTANDVLEYLVKDDLTGLINIRAFAHVGVLVANP